MSNHKGTKFETACVGVAHETGWPDAERLTKKGAADEGDLRIVPGFTIEAKDEAKINLAGAIDEARVEAGNADLPFFAAVVKRRGKHARQAYLVQELGPWLEREKAIAVAFARAEQLEAALALTDAVLEQIGVVCRASGETFEIDFRTDDQ